MKLSGFETRVVAVLEDGKPVVEAPGPAAAHFVLLRLRSNDGLEGIAYAGFVHPLMVPALKAAVDAAAGLALGEDPLCREAIAKKLQLLGGGAPAGLLTRAISAVDTALWDLEGKALGQPVYRLLGGYRNRVPAYASGFLWRHHDLPTLDRTARRLVDEGFTAMKFRIGGEGDPARELERVRVMREAVGDRITLMVDINQGWDVNQAISIGRELKHYNLYWLEDPVQHQDCDGLARIAEALDTPIATGEYHYGIVPFRHMLEKRAIDIVMVDLLRVGGLTQFMKVAHLAEAFDLPVVSHLAPEVLVHAIAAAPNGAWVEHMPWIFPLLQDPPHLEAGLMVLPDAPGLGFAFDEQRVRRYTVE